MRLLSEGFRTYAEERLAARAALLEPLRAELAAVCAATGSEDERALIRYHLATMPLSDVFDTPPAVWAACARHALELRERTPWGPGVPEAVFVHYAACPRVNSERLTACWGPLREAFEAWRANGAGPGSAAAPSPDAASAHAAPAGARETAIAVNYWCASVATYQGTDPRTLSPAGIIAAGFGRCGEESTLLVSALRASGIPARQLYTPWWAHCDDNHAWVEAYVDGGWHYLGACEPEEELDRGWFTAASGRALLVHTRLFSDYGVDAAGNRALWPTEGCQIMVNLTGRYAPTTALTAQVSGPDGAPAAGADLRLQVINESVWRDVAELRCDARGQAQIDIGQGSIRVVAAQGPLLAARVIDTAREDFVALSLERAAEERLAEEQAAEGRPAPGPARGANGWHDLDLRAPADHPAPSSVLTPEQAARGRARRQAADAERAAARERDLERARALAARCACAPEEALPHLERALGNAKQVAAFLGRDAGRDRLELLATLSEKDFFDLCAEVLEDHLAGARAARPEALAYLAAAGLAGAAAEECFRRFVLCPRAGLEHLSACRLQLREQLGPERARALREDPASAWAYLRERLGFTAREHVASYIASPLAALASGEAGPRTRRVLFVNLCRAAGVPARIDRATGEAEYFAQGAFVPVERPEPCAVQRFTSSAEPAPRYYRAWAVSRLQRNAAADGGDFVSYEELDFEGAGVEDSACELALPAGSYLLTCATRLPDGGTLAAERRFCVDASGRNAPIELRLRRPNPAQLLQRIPLAAPGVRLAGAPLAPGEPLTVDEPPAAGAPPELDIPLAPGAPDAPGLWVLAFVQPGAEPSAHLLAELAEHAAAFERAGVGVRTVADADPADVERLARRMFADPEAWPLTLLARREADGTLTGLFAAAGYRVGTAALLLQLAALTRA